MIKLEEHKSATHQKPIENAPLPSLAYIPLSQHIGKLCSPEVKPGDTVSLGQRIAGAEAPVYAPIHASVSGKIISIEDRPHPVLTKCKTIVIANDAKDNSQSFRVKKPLSEIEKLTPEQIRKSVFEAGIVGLGGASFPTHIKLNPPKPVDTLIINGAECEPYLTGDFRLMIEKTNEILEGVHVLEKCLGVKNTYIAIEDNKPEAIEKFKAQNSKFKIVVLKSRYPQGGEKQLIKNVLAKEVPQGKLPFEVGVVVQNVATVNAIYEAVYFNKPLYERVVTVTGSPLSNPKNLLARIGTPIKELIDFCGPLNEKPAKIIIGGPMMGIAQYTDEVPVIKSTTGIVLLSKKEAAAQEEQFCIRCGACIRACPAGLMPCLINLASEKEMWTEAKAYNALDCIECGLCNYLCPANRKLTQSIKRAKFEANK
ncbi:MAG: electron transport complex subunit RsxC [Candidatus Omnitrophica bacterium]|nr:electron transport complex subunit RsxC [Candidatus Omnitrophota bacterium]